MLKNRKEKLKELLEYEFEDGKAKETPIAVTGPDGTVKTMLRVYAYGGCIGRVAAETGNNHLADTEYAKYLKDADMDYLQNMTGKYPDLEKEPGACLGEKLSRRLGRLLELSKQEERDQILFEPEYLDLILKAAKEKFTKDGRNAKENEKERSIQTAVVKKHMRKNPGDGWCIMDMEYAISEDGKITKPDIVVFDKDKGFGLIELKYNNDSCENLGRHYEDFKKVSGSANAPDRIQELCRRSRYLAECGLINREFHEMAAKALSGLLWYGFLFLGGEKSRSAELAGKLAQKYKEITEDENCRFCWFPYDECDEKAQDSLDRLDLRFGQMNAYQEFIKDFH